MKLYYEWASTPKSRKGRMISEDAIITMIKMPDPGYSSVYRFNEADAQAIKDSGNSKNFKQYEVTSDTLIFDIDSGKGGLDQITPFIEHLTYDVWESGGKGYHIYISHSSITSIHLPNSHKMAAEMLLKDKINLIDATLYQHARLLSLPGRIHPITRKRKKFLYTHPGKQTLEFPILEEVKRVSLYQIDPGSDEGLVLAFQRLGDLVTYPPDKGKRHFRIWAACNDLALSGIPYETALILIDRINQTWEEQKTIEELEADVKSAYRNMIND